MANLKSKDNHGRGIELELEDQPKPAVGGDYDSASSSSQPLNHSSSNTTFGKGNRVPASSMLKLMQNPAVPYTSPYSAVAPVPPPKKTRFSSPADQTIHAKAKDNMPHEGIDLTVEAGQASGTISWHEPHPIFVILLVGPGEVPFGIQKDLLCAQSPYYRQEFAQSKNDRVEHIVKLPDTDHVTFGCFQNFIYTGEVYDKRAGKEIPDYPVLMGVWRLATFLKMAPLRVAVLNAMAERREQTDSVPSAQLLIQAWKETEEGSGLRKMFIGWAADYMRSCPPDRNSFATSLPQEILSTLAVVLSELPAGPGAVSTNQAPKRVPFSVNDLEADQNQPVVKRPRHSTANDSTVAEEVDEVKPSPSAKKIARKSDPGRRNSRRVSTVSVTAENDPTFTAEKELEFCRGLIDRMISGPGYWTRYVTHFKQPVDPVADEVPNYFDVVKRPMDLSLIRTKMMNNEYKSGGEFEADIRLIFQNCYEYWTPGDPIWRSCEDFEIFFNSQWAIRHKYIPGHSKRIKPELMQ